ncbi:ABC transporter substrate-binding protein [Pseudonocardia nigra]|uniref:ABC transporter substrate-binding protein n=1 Tax=Pseudonocardia nigra TaxID=1921578 RepID=UPI0027E36EB7|nr:ABC transporter substrate-binding protein [Pseudonocardia nigra]
MSRRVLLILGAVLTTFVAACSVPTAPGGAAGTGGTDGSTMVLADGFEPESLHPLLGYGVEGASKIFDGLVAHDADRQLQPALAAALPTPSADALSWTVPLREGVTFHDGSAFDADDVVATYRALLDPAYAASIRSDFVTLAGVEKVDATTVRFTLTQPDAAFPHRLTLGIVPAEAVATPEPLAQSEFSTAPIGTGPYRLGEWRRGTSMTLEANEQYFGGAPAVRTIEIVFATDDNTRAQRLQAGEFDGTVLPPALAQTFAGSEYTVRHHPSADYRAITLPSAHPVTSDPAIRLALNYAANRQGMIDGLLAGQGRPASNPIPEVLAEYAEPSAQFRFDRAEAERILDAAGWVRGPDGIRVRDGVPARFTLMYPAADTVRRDLAQAFTSDASAVGIDVALEGLGWEAIEPRMEQDALVLGGGSPFDPDIVSYPLLHSSYGGDGFNNPGSYANPEVDATLDAARRALDPAERVAAVKAWQRAYAEAPGYVFLVFLDHSYLVREKWDGYEQVVDPHTHGTTWGPWWNVEDWTPKA